MSWIGVHCSFATHLRAADIVAERTGNRTYTITVTVYSDWENVPDTNIAPPGQAISMAFAPVSTSDGWSDNVPRTSVQYIGNGTFENKYVFSHTFPAAGAGYFIRYREENRNSGILNLQAPTDQHAMFVETFIFIDAFDPNLNRTPQLLVPPIDLASVGQIYTHNPGAYDLDGDSISFRLIAPQSNPGEVVDGYVSPADPSFGGGSTFSLNQVTGDISWDTPLQAGEYNIAFRIEEWRSGIRIGYVIRDMQIIVEPNDNIKPEILIPPDTCVIAGQLFEDTIFSYDPDNDPITNTYFGGMFQSSFDSAYVIEDQVLADSIVGYLFWTPSCEFIRQQDHQAIFKVEDAPTDGDGALATLKTWLVQVYGPPIQGMQVAPLGIGIQVSWDLYDCGNAGDVISIWRRECDTNNIVRSPCTVGVPEEWGFVKVGEVSGTDTLFFDDNGGEGFSPGVTYYYLTSVDFGAPNFGESVPSEVVSASLGQNLPILNLADVLMTDTVNGEIEVGWYAPLGLDTNIYPGPYQINIYRNIGFIKDELTSLLIGSVSMNTLVDSSFSDMPLNTSDTSYTYYIEFLSGSDTIGTTVGASTEWLMATPQFERVDLSWTQAVPWSLADTLYQVIWMDSTGTGSFFAVDSVIGSVQTYLVDSLTNCENYCFYVEARGVYCHDSLKNDILVNRSQIKCAVPVDTVPPCPPTASLVPVDCEFFTTSSAMQNHITWQKDNSAGCDDEPIVAYRIYFRNGLDGDFGLLATINDSMITEYYHDSLESMTLCYVVTAIDKSGNESPYSNEVCGDNCEYFELPNIFTPNGEGVNDVFEPTPVPRFTEMIEFEVYNRWGKLVFQNVSENIDWDGKNMSGQEVADGVYYYRAVVTFDKLNPEEAIKEYKGWVMIMR